MICIRQRFGTPTRVPRQVVFSQCTSVFTSQQIRYVFEETKRSISTNVITYYSKLVCLGVKNMSSHYIPNVCGSTTETGLRTDEITLNAILM